MKAVIWDVDGTLAETERDGHRVAFNQAFEQHGLPWRWSAERYGELLAVTGGRERLLFDMQARAVEPADPHERDALARRIHATKNEMYAAIMRQSGIPLRPGVRVLMEQCRSRGILMAIATTTSRDNVTALLRAHLGENWREWFHAVVCGEDTAAKKPDPEVYHLALAALQVSPTEAIAMEDSPPGALAANAAGVPVVVARGAYFRDAVFSTVLAIGDGLDLPASWQPPALPTSASPFIGLEDFEHWLAARDGHSMPAGLV